ASLTHQTNLRNNQMARIALDLVLAEFAGWLDQWRKFD
ncbi:MAG: hypothetical protein RL167_514, partial [Actinomycetota bacterium]